MTYRYKPHVVYAVQWLGDNEHEISFLFQDYPYSLANGGLLFRDHNGSLRMVHQHEWIVRQGAQWFVYSHFAFNELFEVV